MDRSFFLFVFICAFNLNYLVPSSSATPIVGGVPLMKQHFTQHIISLHRLKDGPPHETYEFFCSGNIISQKHILTAARCFLSNTGVETTNLIQKRPKVIAGTIERYGRGIEQHIIRVFIPRVYESGTGIGDIAVAELINDIVSNDHRTWYIHTADLDPQNGAGEYAHFFAFGATAKDQPINIADMGHFLGVYLWSREKCRADDSIICASSRMTYVATACNGDAGAGLILNNKIIGVLNHGPPNCNTNAEPIMFTRIKTFRSFIVEATNPQGVRSNMRVLERSSDGAGPSHPRSSSPPRRT